MTTATATATRPTFSGDLRRAGEVAGVLVKYGLAAWLKGVEWEPLDRLLHSRHGQPLVGQPFEVRVRLALSDLGPTFIKLGQMLSTREHLIGARLAAELATLRESAPPDPPEVVRQQIEKALGRPVAECFASFEDVPLASASIGQVHRVRLLGGEDAVVKVLHRGILHTVQRDLEILAFLAQLAERNEQLRHLEPVSVVREFSRMMLRELDFRQELRNLAAFRRNFEGAAEVRFPVPYPELSTGEVLTMEYFEGLRITEEEALQRQGIDRERIARIGATTFLAMIFRDGFYHADPHPGNILVLRDGTVGIIDAGMAGRIDPTTRRQFEDLLLAAGAHDGDAMTDVALRVCRRGRGIDRDELRVALTELFEEYGNRAANDLCLGEALRRVIAILYENKLRLPSQLSMLIKCIVILEGTGRLLNPSFNLAEMIRPWRKKIMMRRISPKEQWRRFRHVYSHLEQLAETAPRILVDTMDRLEKGEFAVRIEHRHLRSAANRLVVGLFTSALLISSAILIALHVPPMIGQISILGMAGYMLAMVVGVHMLWVNRDKIISRHDRDWD